MSYYKNCRSSFTVTVGDSLDCHTFGVGRVRVASQERGCKHGGAEEHPAYLACGVGRLGWVQDVFISVDKTTTFLGSRFFSAGPTGRGSREEQTDRRDGGEGGGVPPVVFGVAGEDYTTPDAEFAGGLDCD